MKTPRKYFLETKLLFCSTLVIITLVILCVWFSGMASHRSLFQNSVLSTSIVAGSFFLFISLGLYYGLKLKDNVGTILSHEKLKRYTNNKPTVEGFDFDAPEMGDGLGGAILSLIAWIVFSVLLVFLFPLIGLFFWSSVLFLIAMLYWIFFRALRLVFKNSGKCKGNIIKSLAFGFFYSLIYVFWIYGIIFFINYINR
nr:hypothetical protein [uncultured Chryseobacterium sp.]